MAWNDLASNECPTKADIESIGRFVTGMIIAFRGTSIPSGWALCNGQNGTPNLVGKFIRGGTSYGTTGGSDTVTLTSSNLPSHSHSAGSLYTSTNGNHNHGIKYENNKLGDDANTRDNIFSNRSRTGYTEYAGSHSHSIYGSTGSVGGGSSFSILPSYYTLVYIMKL